MLFRVFEVFFDKFETAGLAKTIERYSRLAAFVIYRMTVGTAIESIKGFAFFYFLFESPGSCLIRLLSAFLGLFSNSSVKKLKG